MSAFNPSLLTTLRERHFATRSLDFQSCISPSSQSSSSSSSSSQLIISSEQGAGKGLAQRSANSSEQPAEDQDYHSQMMELLRATARLAVRLEDQPSLDRLDKAFLIHQRTQVPECMLTNMFKISETWKEAKAAVPPKVTSSHHK